MSASGGIIFNEKGQILIVKPTYRGDWLIPGGVIEKNESPSQACIREIKEEIGLDLIPDKLLCMEYHLPHGEGLKEAYKFLFHVGVINQKQIDKITLQESELSEFQFIDPKMIKDFFDIYLYTEVDFALRAMRENRIIYLENMKESKNLYPSINIRFQI